MSYKLILLFICMCITGCEKSSVKTYHIPKQVINVASLKFDKPLSWVIPTHWEAKEKTQFRIESRSISDTPTNTIADFSITKFPDKAGNLLANVNRWRSQLDLEPVNEESISNSIKKINHNFLDITFISFESKSKQIENKYFKTTYISFFKYDDFTYYVKLTGESNHLKLLLNEFNSFMGSIVYETN